MKRFKLYLVIALILFLAIWAMAGPPVAPSLWKLVGGDIRPVGDRNIAIGDAADIKYVRVQKDHDSDLFDAAATSDSAIVWQQPANSVLLSAKYILDAQFAASGLSDLDLESGLVGDNNGLLEVTGNLFSDAVDTEYKIRGAYWNAATAAGYHTASAVDWVAYSSSTGANLSTTSAGSVAFYFAWIEF